MPQTTLENYFNSRKRQAVDDIKKVNEKVLILDKNVSNTSKEVSSKQRTIIYQESPKSSSGKLCTPPKLQRRTPKTVPRSFLQGSGEKYTVKSSTRKSLLSTFNATESKNKNIEKEVSTKPSAKKSLLTSFEASSNEKEEDVLTGVNSLSDTSTASSSNEQNLKIDTSSDRLASNNNPDNSTTKSTAYKTLEKLKNKDFDYGLIKKKLIKSSRLEDLKKALKKVNESSRQLEEIQSRKQTTQTTPSKSASLKQFKAIEFEITSPRKMIPSSENINKTPDSPSLLRKSIFMSPCKTVPNNQPYISPRKLFSESINSAMLKSPEKPANHRTAYERFYALSCSGKPAFTLPYKYRSIAETFRAVDTVISMMHNRKEAITFSKLKLSVQQFSKKNLYESHLGQIETIFPKAYTFKQEKLRVFGNQKENYELVIKPVFEFDEQEKDKMTPSVLLERRRIFYNTLLEMVKSRHEEFLKTLDPPLIVPKEKLTRWHPAFDVEICPDITTASLPQPPNIEKCSTAKDVLNKAKDVFCANPRMEKALQKLTENSKTNTTSTSETIPALANALRGIPKSILEKVRARQAAKAMELLTRNPEENKRRYELTRLPELARILRNIFITQKKNVIIKSIVLQKMCESYREIMDQSEMSHHLDLLLQSVPGWILPTTVDNKEFLKLCKDTDMSEVMTKLNRLIEKNSVN